MPVGFTRLRLDIRSKPPGLSGWPESILRQFQGVKSFLKVCTISPSDSWSDSYHPGRDNLSHSCHINTDQCELLRISSQQSWQTGRGLRDNVMVSLDKSGRKKWELEKNVEHQIGDSRNGGNMWNQEHGREGLGGNKDLPCWSEIGTCTWVPFSSVTNEVLFCFCQARPPNASSLS